jgi:succinate dehydrogenase/fumarate reductase flavoprotein subunit
MAGDGLAMAWRVGASLVNLEMQWWHTNDVAHPPAWQRVQIYPNPVLASQHSARMVNSRGEEFFNQQIDDPMAFGPYTVQLKRLVEQVRAGKARYDGGYYAGFDHVDSKEIDAYTTYNKPFYQLGLDPKKGPIETAVTAHYRQGGILVDTTKMRSTVPGLYVAGGVGGHSNGLIALVTFDGKCVADGVAEDIDEIKHPLLPEQEVAIERHRLDALLSSNGTGHAPAKVKEAIRNVMWDKVGVEKNHAGLISALKDLDRIRTMDVPHMRLKNKARVANYEWVDAMDVHNMIDVAELVVHASIERQESRGPFIRTDFPETDNEKWLAANIMIKTDNGFSFKQVPYETPFFAPEFARRDNMSVPW